MIQSFEEMKSKLNEGNIKTIDNEQNQEDITIAVSTEIPEETNKVEKDDKTDFEEFKIQYKGVIDIKCRQDFGDCEDEKLWEDTAKELFLQSKNYILVGDEYKAKEDLDDHLEKIEESKEIVTEDIDEGNSIFEMKFDCSNTDVFGEGEDLYNTVGAKVAEIAEKIKSGRLDGAIMDINGNKIGSYGVGYEGVMSALDESKDPEFNYKLLDRLKSDCEYFLGNGNRSEKHLWAGNVNDQIAKMKEIYNSLEEKPEWLTMEQIDEYAEKMTSKDLNENKKYDTLAFAQLLPMSFTDMVDNDIYDYIEEDEDDSTPEDIANYYISQFKDNLSKEDAEEFDDELAIEYIKYKLDNKSSLEESKIYSEEDIEKTIKEYLVKTNGIFTDDSIYDIVEELCGESDIDKMPEELVNQVRAKVNKDNKIEEKRELPENEKEILKNNMRKVLKQHGKFKDDEELEDYIEEFMPLWIEAQENLGTEVLPLDEGKEIKTEDQYEMERRKGRPNLEKIAKEVFEYDDYYTDVVDNFNTEREFIIEHIAEVAAEYNLKEQAAWAVMEKIYKMAKEAKSNKVEESMISEYTLNELSKVLNSDADSFKLKVTSLNTPEETKWLNIDKEDLRVLYNTFGGSEKKEETIEGMDIFDPELPENKPDLNNYGGEAQEAVINIENKVKALSMKELNKIADEAFLEIVYSKKGFMDLVYGSQDKDIIEINNKYFK